MSQPTKWTADLVASLLVNCQSIGNKLLVVPRCCWTGHEADLLIVEARAMRLIDIEIKISRADLKADAAKDKWVPYRPWSRGQYVPAAKRQWPSKVWKHYYAMPEAIWSDDMIQAIPDASGILLVTRDLRYRDGGSVTCLRRAVPDRKAQAIGPGDVLDIARLSSLRYWSLVREQSRIDRLNPTTQEIA